MVHSQFAPGLLRCSLRMWVVPSVFSLILGSELCHDVVDGLGIGLLWETLHCSERGFFQVNLVIFASKHALVMKKHLLRESLENPLVLQRLKWRHSVNWVPVQTLVDKVQELCILALTQHILECLRVWQSSSAS